MTILYKRKANPFLSDSCIYCICKTKNQYIVKSPSIVIEENDILSMCVSACYQKLKILDTPLTGVPVMNRHSAVVRTKLDKQSVENKGDSGLWSSPIHHQRSLFNPFVPNAPFLCLWKTSENLMIFICFQGVGKGCTGNKWVKGDTSSLRNR